MSIEPYQLEPEYSSSEQGEEEQTDSGKEEVSSLDSSRLESRRTDLSWCEYERCCVMPSEVECDCCKELPFLSQLVEAANLCIVSYDIYKLNIVFFKVILLCSVSTVHLVGSWVPWQKNLTCGIYTGYLPGDDDDDSAFDSELEQAWRDFLNI
ncbi:unnamed protein product [Porites evermanni]|uniref:Uncharacterized protein n=1 Tax=Porites evermanni TaxID=104178 RepID=A0ABN8NAM7_9CNID|nr:unnamed protein product [Porites evermanni]